MSKKVKKEEPILPTLIKYPTLAILKDREHTCSCGHTQPYIGYGKYECQNCGNKDYYCPNTGRYPTTHVFDVVNKTDKTFHVFIYEIYATLDYNEDEKRVVKFQNKKVHEVKLNYITKEILMSLNGKTLKANESNLDRIFNHVNTISFIDAISTERSNDFWLFIYRNFGCMYYERADKFPRALFRSFERPYIEIMYYAGFDDKKLWHINRNEIINKNETKPHKILDIPKSLMQFAKEVDLNSLNLRKLRNLSKFIDPNSMSTLRQIFKEEAGINDILGYSDELIELINEYEYKDIGKLALYVARRTKLQQGITNVGTAIVLLRDYVRMCKAMEIKHDPYPDSLKKVHDIAQMNFKVKEDEYQKKLFIDTINQEDYKKHEYKGKRFSIITPQEPNDLVKEGSSLNHCIASYVKDVISRKCKIYFLRDNENISKPLVSIEVRENFIRQVSGFGNRFPNQEESDFIKIWAEKKELVNQRY